MLENNWMAETKDQTKDFLILGMIQIFRNSTRIIHNYKIKNDKKLTCKNMILHYVKLCVAFLPIAFFDRDNRGQHIFS